MQASDSESVDSAVPLFDVVISMPLGASLETIQQLAETEAGLAPDRVERLIKVLRGTPNAKVGAAVTMERAEEERLRFTKAGLDVDIIAHQANGSLPGTRFMPPMPHPAERQDMPSRLDIQQTDKEPADFLSSAGLEKNVPGKKNRNFQGKTALSIGIALAVAAGLLYIVEKGSTDGGVSLAWIKKEITRSTGLFTGAPHAAVDPNSDSDADDLLIQAARGKRVDAKLLTLEEALAAAVGGTNQPDASLKQTKQLLTAELASLLAELGQIARSREVLKALAGSIKPAADATAASALKAAQLKLQAWSTLRMDGSQALQTAEDLKAKTQAISNAQERMQLQGQIAVVLSRHTQLPAEVPRAFLSLGAESLKATGAAHANAALGELAVCSAEVFLHETTARAKSGGWTKAKASAAQIEDLLKQVPDAWAQTRLYAVDYQAKLQTGQSDKATKSLESALSLAGKNPNLAERAVWLRSIAQLSDSSTQEAFESLATSLQNQLNAKSGLEKARGLTELSLLYTAAGLPGKAAQLGNLAQTTAGLNAADTLTINTDLIVRGDMAAAKMLHGLGRYAEAEAMLQRVSGYLF